jgi:cytochrome c oxidase cbb3-type subunit 3
MNTNGRFANLAGLAVLMLGAVGTAAAEPALESNNCAPPTEGIRGNPENGQEIHLENCAECHGYDGKAEVIVMHMDEPPRDQTDVEYMKTLNDAFLYLAICSGGDAVGRSLVMPGWGDVLSDQDIRDLVAWVRTFSGT